MKRKLNVLIISHEFSPYQGSECSVGWNLVNEISNYHNLSVIYASTNQFKTSNYRNHVESFFSKSKAKNNFNYISISQPNLSKIISRINKFVSKDKTSIGIPFLYFLAYRFWEKSAYKYVKNNINLDDIDIIHHLTSISFREPGFLWKINKPYFWGPISGNVKIPNLFFKLLTNKQILFQKIRNIITDIQLKYSYRIIKASRKASLIYCVTKEDYNYFHGKYGNKVRYMLDVGCSNELLFNEKISYDTINFIWIGRIVYSKALEILIYSISRIQKENLQNKATFTIIGDGPDIEKNKTLANKLNLKNIFWVGKVNHNEVQNYLDKAHCLVHTSIREATSVTIMEALNSSVPVICHDAFGMTFAVTDDCGIKVPFLDLETSINGFSSSMLKLIMEPKYLKLLSKNAYLRSKELSWTKMAEIISNDYLNIKS